MSGQAGQNCAAHGQNREECGTCGQAGRSCVVHGQSGEACGMSGQAGRSCAAHGQSGDGYEVGGQTGQNCAAHGQNGEGGGMCGQTGRARGPTGQGADSDREKLLCRAQGDDFGWARVLLAAARRAGQVREAVTEAVERFSRPGARPGFENAERQLEALAELLEKRERAELILFRAGGALAALSLEERKLLKLRYFGRVPAVRISEALGLSRRTVYRRLDAALAAFCAKLRASEERGERAELLRDSWFRCIAEETLGL